MSKGEVLFEGFSKVVCATEDPEQVIIHYKDTATAFSNIKRATLNGKGVVNNQISSMIFHYLNQAGVRTHFLRQLSEREMLCRKMRVLPLRFVVRNIACGSIVSMLGLKEGHKFDYPIVEMNYKEVSLDNPMINIHHIVALGIATYDEVNLMSNMAIQVNDLLKELLSGVSVTLVDLKLEFGVTGDGEILLADEISPDTCRFWDTETGAKLDKDRFRRDMSDVMAAYTEFYSRLKSVL